jgi:hypothetical protein
MRMELCFSTLSTAQVPLEIAELLIAEAKDTITF